MTRKLITPLTFAFLLTMVFAGKPGKTPTGNKQNDTVAANQKETGRKKRGNPGKKQKQVQAGKGQESEFQEYAIFANRSAKPETTAARPTVLPLKPAKGEHVAYIGNTLLDRARLFGHFETMLHQRFAEEQLVVRNFAWSADEVDLMPRPDNFGTLDQHLLHHKTDIIFAAFGFNESFAGRQAIPKFKQRLATFLTHTKSRAYNGKSGPRIVLISPTASLNVKGVAAADLNNGRLADYTKAMKEVAATQKVGFVDVFSMGLPEGSTFNGVHLVDKGYQAFAENLYRGVFGNSPAPVNQTLRKAVIEKSRQYFRRYRPLNTFYYTGGRKGRYGYLDFLPAMRNFELMTANRDKAIWAIAGGSTNKIEIDDSLIPEMPETPQSRGGNKWMTPDEELKAFKVDPRFNVNCFASEENFPDIACPIQMRWDARGRLWVACSTTYPHVYPGQEPNDKIVILEDTDNDGVADKSILWADDVHIPLSFEFGDGGVYVSEEPAMTFLKDTDGDDKADFRRQVLTGFGCEDSHHALHDFVWTPDGDLLFRDAIFLNSQVETPYGPVRVKNSGWFRFRPATHRLTTFGSYPNTNPWGVTFDDWGHHVASHPVFASTFHATSPPYPTQHPRPSGFQAYSGTCGQEFVDWNTFPEEMQGGFIKVRYKPTNRVEFHQWINAGDHMQEKYSGDIIFSTNLSFIPVDVRFGPRGALYVCDWYNPIKGHAQYSLRDERRDRKSGRIWRITAKDKPLAPAVKIAGATIPSLLENLKRREYRIRYWTKRELRTADTGQVEKALEKWLQDLDRSDPRLRHHQTEALWMYRNIGKVNTALIKELLACDVPQARAAATRQLRYWSASLGAEAEPLLVKAANDTDAIVRLEAAIASSWIGTEWAFRALLAVAGTPMGKHLSYAVQTALGSAKMLPYWKENNRDVKSFLAKAEKTSQLNAGKTTRSASEANFDNQKGLLQVTINCVPERMVYDKDEFRVRPGQPVKLILSNPDATMHNLVIARPGALEKVGIAGNEMAKDPEGLKKNYIPNLKEILWSTPQLKQNTSHVIRFKAPKAPGTYPYLCTFPGHWVIMKGNMVVK
jgi:glucose/arabinose dehydrogenase/plastocyanin